MRVPVPIVGHQGDGNAQKLNVPLGKILRIDVDGRNSANGQYGIPRDNPFVDDRPAPLTEIWAYGFRNPFRFSFDSEKGDLYRRRRGTERHRGGEPRRQGRQPRLERQGGNALLPHQRHRRRVRQSDAGPARTIPSDLIDPIAQYDTHHEGHSVIGGFVYNGKALSNLRKKYVFGDFSVLFKFPRGPHDYGRLFVTNAGSHGLNEISQLHVVPGGALSLALLGWGQDASGEIYALGNISGVPFPDPELGPTGRALKLVPAPEAED